MRLGLNVAYNIITFDYSANVELLFHFERL